MITPGIVLQCRRYIRIWSYMSTDSIFFLSSFKVSLRICFSLLTASPCSNPFLQAKKMAMREVHNIILLLRVAGSNLTTYYSLVNAPECRRRQCYICCWHILFLQWSCLGTMPKCSKKEWHWEITAKSTHVRDCTISCVCPYHACEGLVPGSLLVQLLCVEDWPGRDSGNGLSGSALCLYICMPIQQQRHTVSCAWQCGSSKVHIWYLTQVTYVFMPNCRVDFSQNTVLYNI